MSLVVIVGVIRMTGTSCCLWDEAGLDDAGVRGFGGACMMHPSGPCGLRSVWGLEGADLCELVLIAWTLRIVLSWGSGEVRKGAVGGAG